MSDGDAFEFRDLGLSTLVKALSAQGKKLPVAKVGVFGDKNARTGAGSNATIGMKHEFGQEGLPVRSFLRMPIANELGKFLERSNLFTPAVVAEVVQQKTIRPWIEMLGNVGKQVVITAFDTGGFGRWKPSVMRLKKTKQTLVESQQLLDSIEYEVVD